MSVDPGRVTGGTVDVVPSADGIPIAFAVTGRGTRALVLVHGWSCDRTYWRAQVAPLSDAYRVVTIDLAGHGESGGGRLVWTIPSFGADVVAVADRLELRDIVLVGHSMGGDVVVDAAVALGDRVAGLVWVDVYDRLDEPDPPEQVEDFLEPFRADFVGATRSFVRGMFPPSASPALVEQIAVDMSSAPAGVALDALLHAFTNEGRVQTVLRGLDIPKIAINADYEPTDPDSLRVYGFETIIATGVGHFLMLEDPAQFERLLKDALSTRIPPKS
jgi:pimeloyl-ACP methyl ester carboxylesterase